ncbi:MAG: hypothetical protein Q7U20_02775 [Caulobacter sp.]|nr:hypothetical protein [Caulobacter sp.]
MQSTFSRVSGSCCRRRQGFDNGVKAGEFGGGHLIGDRSLEIRQCRVNLAGQGSALVREADEEGAPILFHHPSLHEAGRGQAVEDARKRGSTMTEGGVQRRNGRGAFGHQVGEDVRFRLTYAELQ